MPITTTKRCIVRLALVLVVLLTACSAFFFMPAQPAKADAGDNYPSKWKNVAQDSVVDDWGEYNRECTSWASWALSDRNSYKIPFHDFASGWGADATAIGFAPDKTVAKGAIAWWAANAPGASSYGHVAWVSDVDSSGGITIEQYNATFDGTYSTAYFAKGSSKWPTGFIHFPDKNSSSTPTPPTVDNTILAVKKLTQSDGTNELFWAKKDGVYETWWRGGTGLNTTPLINISQDDVVTFDIQILANNEHLLYTATAHNIWETWWYPGGASGTSLIIPNAGNLRAVQKALAPDGVTHLLYVMNSAGVDEYSWVPSGTIYGRNVANISNLVAMKWAVEPDNTQQLFVATSSNWYMYRSMSGSNPLMTGSGAASGITSLDFSEDQDGKHRLYLGTTTALREVSWYNGTGFTTWQINQTPNIIAVQKWENDDMQVLYFATTYGVYELYWQRTNQASLNGDTIIEGHGTVHAFCRTTDPGFQTVYLAADTRVWEAWWGDGNAIGTGTVI